LGRLLGQQGLDHTPRRATGPQQQHPLAGDGHTQVAADVGHQASAIGVVAKNFFAVEA